MTNPQAGWYPDPSGNPSRQRYWNGTQWTNDYAPIQSQPSQPQVVIQETRYYNPNGTQTTVDQVYYQQQTYRSNSSEQTLRLVAFIFCIVATVICAAAIIPLAWMIPMTVHAWSIYKGTSQNTTAFGVCTLIFVSPIAGILLLISQKN